MLRQPDQRSRIGPAQRCAPPICCRACAPARHARPTTPPVCRTGCPTGPTSKTSRSSSTGMRWAFAWKCAPNRAPTRTWRGCSPRCMPHRLPAPASSSTCWPARTSAARSAAMPTCDCPTRSCRSSTPSVARAATATSTAPWRGGASGTTWQAPAIRSLPNQSYLLRNFRLILSVSLPGSPDNLSRIEELLLLRDGHRATLHAAGFPSRSWTASELINWVSALLDPHRQAGEGIPLTYDPGRELRDQVIDRATRLLIHQTGIELSNPARHWPGEPRAAPAVGAFVSGALCAVEHGQPDRRSLPGHPPVPLPVHDHARRARARPRGHAQLGLPQGSARHHQRHQLHGAFPARHAGTQGGLGHRAQGHGRRPATRRPAAPGGALCADTATWPAPNNRPARSFARAASSSRATP